MVTIRDAAAIVGVGQTDYFKNSGVSTLTLALLAIRAALDDAGLTVHDVDGVACHRLEDSVEAPIVAECLGIRDLHYYVDQSGGGSTSHAVVAQAALAVAAGQAECVVCWRSINARSESRMGGTGQPARAGTDVQYQAPYGCATPPQLFAMAARSYMEARSITAEDLGAVAIAQRQWACQNPRALMRTPLTMEQYLSSRWIVDPLRLYDCCLETDAAVALVITSAARAAHLRPAPVTITAAVWGSGHTVFSNGRSDLTTSGAARAAPRLWRSAGLGPSDVDVVELYDAFTPLVLVQLEDFGFCAPGRAAELVRQGTLPINTHGGHLSAGYVHGLNHIAEAVLQLRGEAGDRQVPGASIALSTGQPGFVAGCTSALVLKRGDR
jgi:acetyl-CoA acetyltransferase